ELSCTWFNESGKTITYGESGQDEMCIMFGYYYPATLDATPCIGL
ncbi:MAG: Copper type ascorbate-dependent monooxygenase, C-terminal domain, partial [Deltaproteobacteria bacterium]|nr:Copper type ascorbate-dependent monooxygenase, C-terminal domain [Deltaproteobacteria bacterium]